MRFKDPGQLWKHLPCHRYPGRVKCGEKAHQDEIEDDHCVLDAGIVLLRILIPTDDMTVKLLRTWVGVHRSKKRFLMNVLLVHEDQLLMCVVKIEVSRIRVLQLIAGVAGS